MSLNKKLISHLSKEEVKEFEQRFKDFQPQLKRLREVLEKELESNNKKRVKDDYSSPSWAMQQADCNGYERSVQLLLDLLSVRD